MIVKGGIEIRNLETWHRLAGPKRQIQWKDGKSAKEAARFWLAALPSIPRPVGDALRSHPDFSALGNWVAEPEAQVRFDGFPGEPSNVDILVRGADTHGPIVIAVEAKADESFGGTLSQTLKKAESRLEKNPRSKGVDRIRRLGEFLFGLSLSELSSLSKIRYQLLTVSAATLAEAERCGARRAVVMVQEFLTSETENRKHLSNAIDLNKYLTAIWGKKTEISAAQVVGPVWARNSVSIGDEIALYVGKVSMNLR